MKLIGLVFVCVCFIFVGCSVQGMSEYNKGLEYQSEKKIDLAEHEYKLALQKNPYLAEAHMNLAVIYLERGWLDGAEASAKRAVEVFEITKKTLIKGSTYQQSLSLAYNNLGVVEMHRAVGAETKSDSETAKARWKNGMSYFQKAVELDSSNSQAQANIERFKSAYKE
jgi:tetratricopeptide (TPR) repeat protein